MSIKVIVELQAKPGMRDELLGTLNRIIEENAAALQGYIGSTRYAVVDQPDMLVEIAEWETLEQRNDHMKVAMANDVFAPLMPLLGAPFRVNIIAPLT